MDFLSFSQEHEQDASNGFYYEQLPDSPEFSGVQFGYEYINPFSKSFKRIFSNVTDNNDTMTAIKTKSSLEFKVGGYIRLQNRKLYQIEEVMEDYEKVVKSVFRAFYKVTGVIKTIRLIEVENPFEL